MIFHFFGSYNVSTFSPVVSMMKVVVSMVMLTMVCWLWVMARTWRPRSLIGWLRIRGARVGAMQAT